MVSYAPGRIEVLGNHTDYNDGFVLSAAIDHGTCVAVSGSADGSCTVYAVDLEREVTFDIAAPSVSESEGWANYVKGVAALLPIPSRDHGFHATVTGDVPRGAGLSSSAALEVATGLALANLYGLTIAPLEMARIAQRAEHEYAGVRCGLLDQISSLYGAEHRLIMTDFRSLAVETVDLGEDLTFLIAQSGVRHALVDGEYNERRAACESAAAYFAMRCDHAVSALRDVSESDLETRGDDLDAIAYRRAAHVVGENRRVQQGREVLGRGDVQAFGALMFQSHESSRLNFENSCPELDLLVKAAAGIPEALGARLSGGGFGGGCVVLLRHEHLAAVSSALQDAFRSAYSRECAIIEMRPSAGAELLQH